ncbi:16S rRNA (guanine(966)-N(2))-methyltransferase RsmD [Thalassomonas viridans]|uniref:Ribosomal RNA small subunit methyltransferase D n=1 Tax=Thalassomonas viridans TaxID=137584 RepID=A0AAE9Z282_9GAMM|nr:16S rRNA (guanine(966)-N(2))-methyltransferase RsmD [Thalassomonas viridans]WDE05466.1 16S rRNA (guanine(966)-N(2))-methyltransferase RsmD [Thalassomonas viridans]
MNKRPQKNKQTAAKGNIRIIAGKHRGRKLPVILAEGLRPTTDRVKETVFNWLMPYIQQSTCLDCFAGSGSLGFEALSRGAGQVTLLELNKTAVSQLKQNQQLLKAENMHIVHTDSLSYLRDSGKSGTAPLFDLVFLDPPFNKQLAGQAAALLNSGWLAENAIIYVETEQNSDQQLPANWQLLKEKNAGQVSYRLYRYCAG